MKLSDLKIAPMRRGVNMLIYGPPKGGKTKLAGSLAKRFKLWWFDLENGIQTLLNDPDFTPEMAANVEVFQIPDTKLNPVAIETMLKVLTGNPVKICENHGKVNCLHCMGKNPVADFCANNLTPNDVVVIDSLSQLSDSAYNQVMGPDIDPQKEWKHYDAWNQRIAMCLSLIQQAPFHTLFLGHAKMVEQQDGTEKLTPVGGTRAFSANLARYFGHVLYSEPKAGKFFVGSKQDYAANIQLGTRADLKYGENGVTLEHFFLPPSELPANLRVKQAANVVSLGVKK